MMSFHFFNRNIALVAIVALVFFETGVNSYSIQYRGSVRVHSPGYVSLVQSGTVSGYDLYVSSFSANPLSSDHVYRIKGVDKVSQLSSLVPETITNGVVWPNEINLVPDSVFGRKFISLAGGFLVPFKTHGSINLFDVSHDTLKGPYDITNDNVDHSYFYHRVMWVDMDGDGKEDALTCRAKTSVFGGSQGQLLWFQYPTQYPDAYNYPWRRHVISTGPDTYFTMVTLTTPDGSYPCIVTAGYFSDEMKIYWNVDGSSVWTDKTKLQSRVIVSGRTHIFDVQAADVNGDGRDDLLVTTNAVSAGGVYVYEIPQDFRTGTFTKHTLKIGFKSHNVLPGGGAPGSPKVISRKTGGQTKKPLIVISGDDDSKAYILSPTTDDTTDWTYTSDVILDMRTGTVGEIAIGDVDGDSTVELFIPAYSNGTVFVYSVSLV